MGVCAGQMWGTARRPLCWDPGGLAVLGFILKELGSHGGFEWRGVEFDMALSSLCTERVAGRRLGGSSLGRADNAELQGT